MKEKQGNVIDRPTLPVEETQLDEVSPNLGDYAVKAYNNEITSFMSVVGVFVISCGYDQVNAERFAMKIHKDGFAVCFWGSKTRCEEVIKDFNGIGVQAILLGGSDGKSY
jgi:ATP-dependent Clp protease adapter protein ClpS